MATIRTFRFNSFVSSSELEAFHDYTKLPPHSTPVTPQHAPKTELFAPDLFSFSEYTSADFNLSSDDEMQLSLFTSEPTKELYPSSPLSPLSPLDADEGARLELRNIISGDHDFLNLAFDLEESALATATATATASNTVTNERLNIVGAGVHLSKKEDGEEKGKEERLTRRKRVTKKKAAKSHATINCITTAATATATATAMVTAMATAIMPTGVTFMGSLDEEFEYAFVHGFYDPGAFSPITAVVKSHDAVSSAIVTVCKLFTGHALSTPMHFTVPSCNKSGGLLWKLVRTFIHILFINVRVRCASTSLRSYLNPSTFSDALFKLDPPAHLQQPEWGTLAEYKSVETAAVTHAYELIDAMRSVYL